MKNSDLYQDITETIVTMLKDGIKPWECPWVGSGMPGFPMNGARKRRYNGVNVLTLWATAAQAGYDSHLWFTNKQAKELGGHVKKSESASKVVYWKILKKRSSADDESAEEMHSDAVERIPLLRYYNVFNLDQIAGITQEDLGYETPEVPDVVAAEDLGLLHEMTEVLEATVHLGGTQAHYNYRTDTIHLPDVDRFTSIHRFYSTLFHELGHWTGHPDRLNRETLTSGMHSKGYAWEELVAELTAAYLSAEMQIPYDDTERKQYEQSAAYLDSWIQALEEEPFALFQAARQAEAATHFISERISA